MRTKQLRVGGKVVEAMLVAGGAGFKIYSAPGFDGWIVAVGRKNVVVAEKSPDFATVSRYVNLRYQSVAAQSDIKQHFDSFLRASADISPPETKLPPEVQA